MAGLTLAAVALLLATAAGAEPSESTTRDRLAEGRRLHDAGDFDAAIRIYETILGDEPDNPTALYETAFSLSARGEHAKAIPLIERMLRGGGGDRAAAYALLGGAHDNLGDLKTGEKTFRKGLKEFPQNGPLHMNLGLNLVSQKKHRRALAEMIENLRIRPSHATGWLGLASTAKDLSQRSRSFFAYARFLALEPGSNRSPGAAREVWRQLFLGVTRQATTNAHGQLEIRVMLDPDRPCDLGCLMMSMLAATRYGHDWENRPDAEFFAHALDTMTAFMQESPRKDSHDPFWDTILVDYFRQAREAGHTEAMAYDMRRSLGEPETLKWLADHAGAVDRLHAWSEGWAPRP